MAENMADPRASTPAGSVPTGLPDVKTSSKTRPPNPVWKMMGLPNLRLKLPSRNWMIFLTVTTSISTAIIYDKREKKRAQKKWCKLVEHLAREPLQADQMPRKLTVFLQGPPTDSLRIAQDHFKDYVKPILVSSGLDWEFVQGRKEGDVRAELAEKIRKFRTPHEDDEDPTESVRRKNGIKQYEGPKGDLVIGRNTWKEYVRGLHEGWLGPLKDPTPIVVENTSDTSDTSDNPKADEVEAEKSIETLPGISIDSAPREDTTAGASETSKEKPKKPPRPPPFISTSEYASSPLPPNLPSVFDPTIPIAFPHILGFSNTFIRMYRFFNRRHQADAIGRETAAIILAGSRPYNASSSPSSSSHTDDSFVAAESETAEQNMEFQDKNTAEQNLVLQEEEKEWVASVYKRAEGGPERTWIDTMVLDPRIASRMRRAELSAEDEERARNIVVTEEEIEGRIKGGLRWMWRSAKEKLTAPKKKHVSEVLQEQEGETWE